MRTTSGKRLGGNWVRRIIAALICLLFVADWASHAVMTDRVESGATALSAAHREHPHEHGGYFCRGEGHREKSLPKGNTDGFQHNGILMTLLVEPAPILKSETTAYAFSSGVPLFRSVSPPFLPPKIS